MGFEEHKKYIYNNWWAYFWWAKKYYNNEILELWMLIPYLFYEEDSIIDFKKELSAPAYNVVYNIFWAISETLFWIHWSIISWSTVWIIILNRSLLEYCLDSIILFEYKEKIEERVIIYNEYKIKQKYDEIKWVIDENFEEKINDIKNQYNNIDINKFWKGNSLQRYFWIENFYIWENWKKPSKKNLIKNYFDSERDLYHMHSLYSHSSPIITTFMSKKWSNKLLPDYNNDNNDLEKFYSMSILIIGKLFEYIFKFFDNDYEYTKHLNKLLLKHK